MRYAAGLTIFLAAGLGGCAAGPDYVRPASPSSPALEAGAFLRAGEADSAVPAARWWDGLGDPVLNDLVQRGLDAAPAVERARARARQARAGIASARAAMFPVLGTSATYAYADLPDEALGTGGGGGGLFVAGFDAQWEADLWGAKGRDIERARADAAAAGALFADAQVSLSAEIARTYVSLRAREASAELLGQRLALETRLAGLAQSRQEGGTGTRQEVIAARRKRDATLAESAAVNAEIAVLRDGLAVLVGAAPGTMDGLPTAPVPLPPREVQIGDPAAMLARRPDVIAAESRLAAATAQIGMAKARRLPGVSLLGLIGIGGSSIGDVFDTSQLSALAVPRLTWSFLDFGRTAAAVRGAEAKRDAALADYRGSVLAALQDAEAALARFGASRIAFARSIDDRRHQEEAARLEELRASAGTASTAQALLARIDWIDAEIAEINRRAQLTISYTALAKSLGLGWQGGAGEAAE